MRFDVAALRAAAEKALASHRAAVEEKHEADLAEGKRQRAEWVEQYGEAWLAATKEIARKIRKGQPVEREDIPSHVRYSQVAYFSEMVPRSQEYQPPPELLSLLRVLDTVADETVTTAGLRDLGVGGAVVRRCVAHMARSSVKA